MDTPAPSTGEPAAPSVPPLWTLADLARYLQCADATRAANSPGFPPPVRLPGVRGPRWHPIVVDEHLRALSRHPLPSPRRTAPSLPLMPEPDIDLLVKGG